MLDEPIQKAVVYLDRANSIRLAGQQGHLSHAHGAGRRRDLIILAPGVREFGEDKTIDGLIRKYGYHGTPATLARRSQC